MSLNPFLLISLFLLGGFVGARLCDFIKIPWVVGYILAGVVLGASGFNILSLKLAENLEFISFFALCLIGFTIGGELEIRELRELGTSILTITVFESLGAFVFVLITIYLITSNFPLALIFGALASATAPAATVDVLWQYHSRGPLTTTLFGVVGMDDAAALIIYAFASSISRMFITHTSFSLKTSIGLPLAEIGGSLVLGAAIGFLIHLLIPYIRNEGHQFIFILSALILDIGLAIALNLSLILSSMAIGFTLINLARENRKAFDLVSTITPPVFLLFFVLVGARLQIKLLSQIGLIGLAYLILRVAGKVIGAYFGAVISHAPETVRKYLGFGLLSQAGVAIGLAIDALHTFKSYGAEGAQLGLLAVNIIAATTFVYQVFGPPFTKYAIFKAGEVPAEYRS